MIESIKSYISFENAIYFFALIAGWPCVFFLLGWLPNYQINYLALFAVCSIFVLFHRGGIVPSPISNCIIFQVVGWFFYSMIHFDSSYYTRIFLLAITFLLLRIQSNSHDWKGLARVYNGWLSLQIVCGTLGVILVLIGILHPIYRFIELDGRPGYFFGLFTTNTYIGGLVRNAGFFDEPGALAFWGMFAILINKICFDNKLIEAVLIIGLVSTASVAYFIQLALYLLVFYRKKTWKLILLVTLIYIALRIVSSSNQDMYNAIFGRFQFDETTGSFAGDNRSMLFRRCWDIFCDYPIFGIGARTLASPEIAQSYGFVGANFFLNWASDGLIGAFITYAPLYLIFKFGRHDEKFASIWLIIIVGMLQRPYDSTQLLYPLMTYTIAFLIYQQKYSPEYILDCEYINSVYRDNKIGKE